jgi:uncharacterized protein YecE (DUF72 family)
VAPAAVPESLATTATALPAALHLGTSSWSFPGWSGIVYDRPYSTQRLARHGLAAYARHPLLTAAGVDRTHYAPVAAGDLAAYAAAVPDAFRFVVKAHEASTVHRWPEHPRYGEHRGAVNPLFLDPAYAADAVVAPYREGLGEKGGALLFQFAPQDLAPLGGPGRFVERLHAFLTALPRGPLYAVEVRNRELLDGAYGDALADAGAVHCLNAHSRMPDVATQAHLTGALDGPALVVRWMLIAGLGYQEARQRYQPFDRLVDEDLPTRRAIAALALDVAESGRPVYVIANNKAEGSAPRTLFRLAELVALLRRGR